jgi:hypothetical protein
MPSRRAADCRHQQRHFETKAADVIGVYLDPLQHAVVFCID